MADTIDHRERTVRTTASTAAWIAPRCRAASLTWQRKGDAAEMIM